MSVRPKKTTAEVIAGLSKDVTRVHVFTKDGRLVHKKPSEVLDDDIIRYDAAGNPSVVLGVSGRPKKPDLLPVSEDVAQVMLAREQHLAEDKLFSVMRSNPSSEGVLDGLLESLAEEAACLSFERAQLERLNQPTSQISVRRSSILKSISDIYIKRKEVSSSTTIDLDSNAFGKLFGHIMSTYRTVFEELGFRPEQIETIFAAISKKINQDWKEQAIRRMSEPS